ncbi:MAG: tetratricopeptide repeat protein [Candidatus Eisenbacteria bacterium]
MSARRRIRGIPPRRSLVVAAAVVICIAPPAWSDDVATAGEAVEKARALARQGHQSDAEAYLAELVREEGGPLAGDATVLLEAARLSSSAEDSRTYAARAIERTRSSALLEAAHTLIGDSYFAESLYVSASHEYEQAARHSSDRGSGPADLKRARSILASGDAGAAVEAYRAIVGLGATPGETTPLAEVGLATALLAAGRPEEAAEQFEATARIYVESEMRPQALAGAAQSRDATGADSLAVAALRRLLSDHPDSYEAVLARERLRNYSFPDSTAVLGDTADTTALETGTPVAPER